MILVQTHEAVSNPKFTDRDKTTESFVAKVNEVR